MRVSTIIEARMASTRFPGKVMVKVNNISLLQYVINRAGHMPMLVDTVVVATPEGEENAPIWDEIKQNEGVLLVKGPEEDVLGRVLKASMETHTDVIVEITADCPLLDPKLVDLCAGYLICGGFDSVYNCSPRSWPVGMDVRVFTLEALIRADKLVTGHEREAYYREHCGNVFYSEDFKEAFKTKNLEAPEAATAPEFRLTVDAPRDLRPIRTILEDLYPQNPAFPIEDALKHLCTLPGYEELINTKEIIAPWNQSLSQAAPDSSVVT